MQVQRAQRLDVWLRPCEIYLDSTGFGEVKANALALEYMSTGLEVNYRPEALHGIR